MSGRVHLVGHLADSASLIAGSDLVAITSGRDDRGMGLESFSLVALEAMALGTPVVAFAAGGVPEVVGECARLVPPGDVAALAQAIADGLKDDDWRADAEACGKQRVVEGFTVDRMVDAMRETYLSAITRRARS